MNLTPTLLNILNHLQGIGAKPLLVGGCVRDYFLNICIKDYDIEVFNIKDIETLQCNLEKFGLVKLVGKSFGVLKLKILEDEYDFSLPRTETKVSLGHRGFKVITNTNISYKDAAKRRDFTINSMAYDFSSKSFLDPFNGLEDLKNKIIRHLNAKTFIDDPLRVYRAIQFASRFDFKIDTTTLVLCREIIKNKGLDELAKERVFEEFKKFLLKSSKPSIAFIYLKKLHILNDFDLLNVLDIKTFYFLDEMVKLKTGDIKRDLILLFTIICYDLDKNQYESKNKPSIHFLNKLTNEKYLINEINILIKYSLSSNNLFFEDVNIKKIKRLSTKVNIQNLCLVFLVHCTDKNIENNYKCKKNINYVLKQAKELNILNQKIKALVKGQDLIKIGFKEGKKFKDILDFALNLQIEYDKSKKVILEEVENKYLK